MSVTNTVVGLAVGIGIGAMDFSLAKSINALVRPSNAHAAQAIVLAGFMVRFGAIGILLWTLSRASNVGFVAVCVGLTGTFTMLAVQHALKTFGNKVQENKRVADRR